MAALAVIFLFYAAAKADEPAPMPAADAGEPSAELQAPDTTQLPEPLEPGEIIFESTRKKALATGKESLLDKYIKESPGNRFAARALETVAYIRYRRYLEKNTMRDYAVFIVNYPENPYTAEAARRMDDLLFLSVAHQNSIEDYTHFIEDFPDHPMVRAAEAAIEDLIFDEVKMTGSIIAWAEFLRGHASSERVAEALALKDELEYEPYKKRDAEAEYREFLRGFPVNRHREEARKRMMELRSVRVQRETETICDEAKMEGSYNCGFVAFDEGTLRVKIGRLSGEEQGQHLLMGGPGYAEEALRRYSAWKNETIKRLLRILGVISVTVE